MLRVHELITFLVLSFCVLGTSAAQESSSLNNNLTTDEAQEGVSASEIRRCLNLEVIKGASCSTCPSGGGLGAIPSGGQTAESSSVASLQVFCSNSVTDTTTLNHQQVATDYQVGVGSGCSSCGGGDAGNGLASISVSYTHLTLPTIRLV